MSQESRHTASEVISSSFRLPGFPRRSTVDSSLSFSQRSVPKNDSRNSTYLSPSQRSPDLGSSLNIQDRSRLERDSNTLTQLKRENEKPWVCSISEGRGTGREIGIAMLNVESHRCVLSQFADVQTYGHLLSMLQSRPCSMILLPSAARTVSIDLGQRDQRISGDPLRQTIQQSFDVRVTEVPRRSFDEHLGISFIDRLLADDPVMRAEHEDDYEKRSRSTDMRDVFPARGVVISSLVRKYYALCAASALFSYLEGICGQQFAPRSLPIHFQTPSGTVMIDSQTAKDLELVRNAITQKQHGSLYGVLNTCCTAMGERLLRMNILQPLSSPELAEYRLDAVEELSAKQDLFLDLRGCMRILGAKKIDLDKAIGQMLSAQKGDRIKDAKSIEAKLQCIINVWTTLHCFKGIHGTLKDTEALLLQTLNVMLANESLDSILDKIAECIDADLLQGVAKSTLNSRNARLLAVKTGKDSILDAARLTYEENTADALDLCQNYAETYSLPFKAVFLASGTGGYSLEVPSGLIRERDLPREFVNVTKKKGGKTLSMTTIPLKKLNQRLHDSATEIFLLSEQIVEALRLEIIRDVGSLYKASEAIALADVMLALSHYTITGRRARPTFGQVLHIRDGRHVVLDHKDEDATIGNNTIMNGGKTLLLLTGPNNSGKTTYLKQVALLYVLAHIGCFVPAEEASFPPADQILSRLSNNEEAEANLSTFASEIRTINYILESATPRSFVVIDELGRNTSTHEGVGIAHAVSEVLIDQRIPTIFATHFTQLCSSLAPYSSVSIQHFTMSVDCPNERQVSFKHRLLAGSNAQEHYGVEMAKMCALPADVISDAESMLSRLTVDDHDDKARTCESELDREVPSDSRKRVVQELVSSLRVLLSDASQYRPSELRNILSQEQRRLITAINETYEGTYPLLQEGDERYSDLEGTTDAEATMFESDTSELFAEIRSREI